MIDPHPEERPTIDDILESDWMKETNKYNEKEEDEIIESEFKIIEEKITKMKVENKGDDKEASTKTRSVSYDEGINFTDKNLNPKQCNYNK